MIRIRKIRVAALLVVIAITALLGSQLLASPSSTATTPIDISHGERDAAPPAIANLDPALRGALRRAARDAAVAGIEVAVHSGWRSPQYQEQLLQEAIAKYGSREEAARWVATPNTSAHVSGDAVDVGPPKAAAWLAEHGAAYGLCRVYDNEPWHFELRPQATAQGCPPTYADPTQDPRMR